MERNSQTRVSFWLAIVALILGGMAAACTESTIISLLPHFGERLQIPESKLGFALTVYMVGVVVGAPLFTVVLVGISRKYLLIAAVVTEAVGNLLTIFAPSFPALLMGRFIAGIPHGAIYGLIALVGAYLAPPGKTARVVSLSFLGAPIANLALVPLMTFVGQRFGYGTAFGIIVGIGLLAAVAMMAWVPPMADVPRSNPRLEMQLFRNRQVVLTLAAALIGFAGLYGFLSYISLSAEHITRLSPHVLPFVMMTLGLGSVCGTFVAGAMSDRFPQAALPITMVSFAVILALAPLMARTPVTAFIEFLLVGVMGPGCFPQTTQVRLIRHAGHAQSFAASLNHAALCMANGIGSVISAVVVGAHLGGVYMYALPAVFCSGLAFVGLGIISVAVWLVKTGRDTTDL